MKQNITLLFFMVLASAFVFGENTIKTPFEKHNKSVYLDLTKDEEMNSRMFDLKGKQKLWLKLNNAEKQQLDSIVDIVWNSATSQWENTYKEEFPCDANGNKTIFISSNWNSTTSQWENSEKAEYTYDANGNETSQIYIRWNSSTSQWENYSKQEYIYDAN